MGKPLFSVNGLTLSVYEPLWRGGELVGTYDQAASGYQHTISSFGGFLDASFSLTEGVGKLEDWFDRGLGRRVVISAGRFTVWEGFVNQLEVNIGGLRKSVGPYLDIVNNAKIIAGSFSATITGQQEVTAYASNTVSIARFGTLTGVYATSGVATANLTYLLTQALLKASKPYRSENLDMPTKTESFTMVIDCAGYHALLGKFPYNSALTTTVNLSDKIKTILQAEPNAVVSTDLSNITPNTIQVSSYENSDMPGLSLIKALVNLGDASGNRYTFGLYENRKAYYKPVVNEKKYNRALRGTSTRDANDALVNPWQIRPGAWVWIADLLPAKRQETTLADDARAIYAETVSFTAPSTVVINGSNTFRIEQRLNRQGLGGMS